MLSSVNMCISFPKLVSFDCLHCCFLACKLKCSISLEKDYIKFKGTFLSSLDFKFGGNELRLKQMTEIIKLNIYQFIY